MQRKLLSKLNKLLKGQKTDKPQNKIQLQFEKLHKDFSLLYLETLKLGEVLFPFSLSESTNQKEDLEEIISNLNTLSVRISNDIKKLKTYLITCKLLTQQETIDVNQSFGDLLTNYEIVFSKFKSYLNKYKFDENSENILTKAFNNLIQSMSILDEEIYKYNSISVYKLLQPFEESKIALKLHNYSFKFVRDNEIGNLVVYR